MTIDEWETQWKRLDQFRVGGDADRTEVSAEWFVQLRHWHIEAVEYGITKLIGTAKDTFLPGLGLLKDYIQERIDRYQRTDGKCQTCHGSTWIDAPPFMENGMIYTGVLRCPDCGIPAPAYTPPPNRRPLTTREHAEYQLGDHNRNYMPPGMGAKHPHAGGNPELKAMATTLRIKLFGRDYEHTDGAA